MRNGAGNHTLVLHDYFASLEGGGRLCSILASGLGCDLGYGFASPHHPFLSVSPQSIPPFLSVNCRGNMT